MNDRESINGPPHQRIHSKVERNHYAEAITHILWYIGTPACADTKLDMTHGPSLINVATWNLA